MWVCQPTLRLARKNERLASSIVFTPHFKQVGKALTFLGAAKIHFVLLKWAVFVNNFTSSSTINKAFSVSKRNHVTEKEERNGMDSEERKSRVLFIWSAKASIPPARTTWQPRNSSTCAKFGIKRESEQTSEISVGIASKVHSTAPDSNPWGKNIAHTRCAWQGRVEKSLHENILLQYWQKECYQE